MNKRLSRLLSLILILCMIPATVITAFARGKGVYNSNRENQSIENAIGQYIPETIKVDGFLNDTGWPASGFAKVDSNTGYWNTQNPTEEYKTLSYKYQIRADYEQLYIGASVVLPQNVTEATFTVYFKDKNEEASGYTDKLVFNLANGGVTQGAHEGITLSTSGNNGCLAVEVNRFVANGYTFEFRNRLADSFSDSENLNDITYFVSVKIGTDELVHPKVALDDTVTVPSFEHWPVNADGTMGGQFVQSWLVDGNKDVMPSEITIDGNFDEATWSSLTNFYVNGGEYDADYDPNEDLLDFNDVKYNYKTSSGSAMKFKYDVRIDGEYLFGAVKAYVPHFEPYTVVRTSDGLEYTMVTAPDLYVYFFSDNDTVGTHKTNDSAFPAEYKQTAYPETVIQIRSQDNPEYCDDLSVEHCYSKYADIYLTKASDTDYATQWPEAFDPAATGFEGTRAAWHGNIYTFEFKVKLDSIPKYDYDKDGKPDIVYNISLADRLAVSGTTSDGADNKNNRYHAWTGKKETIGEHPHYYYQCNLDAGTYFNGNDIEAAKGKVVASKDVYNDGYLAQEFWPALSGGDTIVDGRDKGTHEFDNIAYKLTADYEYLYGAALIKGKDPVLRLYLNRSDDKIKIEQGNVSVTGIWWQNSTNTQVTSRDPNTLIDGIRSQEIKNPSKNEFLAWSDCATQNPTITLNLGSEKRVDRVSAYFHGGEGFTDSGLWGISKPADVKVYYSNDGTNFTLVESELRKTLTVNDTLIHENPINKFNAYQYTAILNKPITAKYVKIEVEAQGSFVWCSEVEVYGDPSFNNYYTVAIEAGAGENEKGLRVYNVQTGTKVQYNDLTNKFVTKEIGTDLTLVEFRLSLLNIGITPSLVADEKDPLLYYFVGATNTGGTAALMHPKSKDSSIDPTQNTWGTDSGAAVLTYGDMYDNISVDGKLDESCWAGENVEMQHVNASNGTWEKAPEKGNTLDYDYRIYSGANYLYGAAVIDTEALYSENAWNYEDIAHTRFNIWIDNKIDEYAWQHDNDPNTVMETDANGVCYENYYYNIYLVEQNIDIPSTSGKQMCGGATPSWYTDASTGEIESIDTNNFKWAITTINGKTYVEFMIALDNFHCDRDVGFNYYVSVTNAYGTETSDDTSDDEILTLYHPELPRTESLEMPLTIYNWTFNDGFPTDHAMLFDHKATDYDDAFDNLGFWEKAVFSPVADKPNVYKVEFIHHAKSTPNYDASAQNTHPATLQEGWFAYALHYDGSNPDRTLKLGQFMQNLKKGDYVVITGLDVSELDVNANATGSVKGLLYAHAYHPSESRDDAFKASGEDNKFRPIYGDSYRFEYKIMSYNDEKAVPNDTYAAKLPTSTTWDETNAGKIMQLSHFAPDEVYVDGDLIESVWDNENGWITVQDNINGSYQEPSSVEEGTQYSYKLITDGEYLYVAMKLGSAYDAANSPSVRLWLKSDNAAKSYTHFYRISYSETGTELAIDLPENASYPKAEGFAHEGLNGATILDNGIKLQNFVVFAKNNSSNEIDGGENYTSASKYGETALFGYSEEVQENMTSGEYYPTINTTKHYHAKESAVMKAGANGGTYVEFKVALSEFGAVDANKNYVGFEYFVQASFVKNGQMNTLFYPLVNIEAASDYSYYKQNFPMWDWSEKTSVKVTAEDIESGEIRMRNNCVPVVTLGAKISENYVASDGTEKGKAIRMGALYTEDYLRKWRPNDENPIKPGDENYDEMNTALINDYWDVADMGIVMLPTQLLGTDEKLTLETPRVVALSADNIVKWVNDSETGWSNFADYENFVFYATLYGVPDNVKVSFCGYVDFYASTGTDSFYDQEIIRSYDMVESILRDDVQIEE